MPLYVGFIWPWDSYDPGRTRQSRWNSAWDGFRLWRILLGDFGLLGSWNCLEWERLVVAGQLSSQIGRKMFNSKEFLSIEYQSLRCIQPSAWSKKAQCHWSLRKSKWNPRKIQRKIEGKNKKNSKEKKVHCYWCLRKSKWNPRKTQRKIQGKIQKNSKKSLKWKKSWILPQTDWRMLSERSEPRCTHQHTSAQWQHWSRH